MLPPPAVVSFVEIQNMMEMEQIIFEKLSEIIPTGDHKSEYNEKWQMYLENKYLLTKQIG